MPEKGTVRLSGRPNYVKYVHRVGCHLPASAVLCGRSRYVNIVHIPEVPFLFRAIRLLVWRM